MNWELIVSVLLTGVTLGAGIWHRRRKVRPVEAIPSEKRLEMMAGLRASLVELRHQLEEDPFRGAECSQRTKVLILHRCGMPVSEISDHLDLPQGEVDLIVQLAHIGRLDAEPNMVRL